MKFWYWLTTYYPRLLPRTEAEWDKMREVLIKHYHVPDHLDVWITVAGQIVGTPSSSIRRSWGYFANVGKRVRANKAIHEEKFKMMKVLDERLRTVAAETSKKLAEEEAAKTGLTPELDLAIQQSISKLGTNSPISESVQNVQSEGVLCHDPSTQPVASQDLHLSLSPTT